MVDGKWWMEEREKAGRQQVDAGSWRTAGRSGFFGIGGLEVLEEAGEERRAGGGWPR